MAAAEDPTILAVRRELESMRSVLQRELANFARSEQARRAPVKARTIQRLLRLGVGDALAGRIAGDVRTVDGDEAAWREALAHLGNRIPIAATSPLHAAGVVALVGPTGAGKTTTAAKLAAAVAARHGRDTVALVALEDPERPVQGPLLAFGQRLGIATCMASSPDALRHTLGSLAGRRLVVIDTPGLARGDARAPQQAAALDAVRGLRRYLVLAANTHYDDLRTAVETFSGTRAAGCILAKLDEATVFGSALSAMIDEGMPLALTTAGQDLEAGLQRPSAHKLVSRAVQSVRARGARARRPSQARAEVPHDG
jgi:flagellar biosynthesis protein FlhF